jgi:hypothetical protein
MAQKIRPQVRKLIEAANALRDGTATYFSITRLTSLKSLCKDPHIAGQFVSYLGDCVLRRMHSSDCPKYTEASDWIRYQGIAAKALDAIEKYQNNQSDTNLSELREIFREAETVQSYTGKEMWGHPIRTIYSREILVIEDAMRCILEPMNAPYWAYQTARDYTERFNPHYGTGLIPESIPMLDDVIIYWSNH